MALVVSLIRVSSGNTSTFHTLASVQYQLTREPKKHDVFNLSGSGDPVTQKGSDWGKMTTTLVLTGRFMDVGQIRRMRSWFGGGASPTNRFRGSCQLRYGVAGGGTTITWTGVVAEFEVRWDEGEQTWPWTLHFYVAGKSTLSGLVFSLYGG